ncbi:hypothetical protein GVAV_000453 [Gurleya vavrai]
MVCELKNHPIHKFLTELMYFNTYILYKNENKIFFMDKKNIHIYSGLLFGFEFIIRQIIFPNNLQNNLIKEKTKYIKFRNSYKICFLKIRKEIQLIFAHLISPFVEISILNLYVEKIISEEKFYIYRCKTKPDLKLLDNNLFKSKKSNILMFSTIFFIFTLNLNICHVNINKNPKFFSYYELISCQKHDLFTSLKIENQRIFIVIACFFLKFDKNFDEACDSEKLLKTNAKAICSFVIKEKNFEYFEILKKIEKGEASEFLLHEGKKLYKNFFFMFY